MAEYIEREKALAFQNELEPCLCRSAATGDVFSATKDADLVAYLQGIPAADVRPVDEAIWSEQRIVLGAPESVYLCSACFRAAFRTSDYCPNCGAKMKRGGTGNG